MANDITLTINDSQEIIKVNASNGSVTKPELDSLNVAFKNEDNNFTEKQTVVGLKSLTDDKYTTFTTDGGEANAGDLINSVLINSQININSDFTTPNDKGIIISSLGSYNVSSGQTLTFDSKIDVKLDKQIFFGDGDVRFNSGATKQINAVWFGATPNSGVDSSDAIRKAIDSAIHSEGTSTVYFPSGVYTIEKPIYPRRDTGSGLSFYNLTLLGSQFNYSNFGGNGGVSSFDVPNEIPFVFGLQGCRGVEIKDLAFKGYMSEPTKEDLIFLDDDSVYSQDRYAPLAAIVIDPLNDNGGTPLPDGYSHPDLVYDNSLNSSKVLIENCSIAGFPTGIALSPNGVTQQGDSISISNVRIKDGVYGVVSCQDQARTVTVDSNCIFQRLKWVFCGDIFGSQTGIMPEVSDIKIADGCAWVFRYSGTTTYAHFVNVYAEGLYGLGFCLSNFQPLSFVNSTFKFNPKTASQKKGYINPCLLYTDNASFVGCTISVGGDETITEPLVISVDKISYNNCYFDTKLINIGVNVSTKNTTIDIFSYVRDSKIPFTTWNIDTMTDQTTKTINYDGLVGDDHIYTLTTTEPYNVGEFVFGLIEPLNFFPFTTEKINTALGEIVSVNAGVSVTFKSNTLPLANTSIKVIDYPTRNNGTPVLKSIDIGSWNMNNKDTQTVSHGLSNTEWLTVHSMSASILNDDDVVPRKVYMLSLDGNIEIDENDFILNRTLNGFFDSSNFNQTGVNKGIISFKYRPD